MVTIRKSEQQTLKFDVQRYQQGGRTAYSLVMSLGTLDSTLPNDMDSNRIKDANRRFNPTHSRRIAEYIYDIDDWVLGAILLGIDPNAVEFVPYSDNDGNLSDALGFIRIPLDGGTSTIKILDGQHRRRAIRTVRERLHQEALAQKNLPSKNGGEKSMKKLERLNEMSIPVMLYAEADIKNLRRMFADLAQTRNIDATTKTRFDDRDPFNRAAVEIVELGRSILLAGKVEMERTIPRRSSNNLLAINQLARCLKVLKYGYGGRASRDRIREARHNYEELIDVGIAWADDFLPNARKEYEELCSIEMEEDFVAKNRSKYVSFSATVLQLMAGCLYEWNKLGQPRHKLENWLQEADFDLNSEECIFLKSGMLIPGDTTLISQRQSMQRTIDYIIEQASLANS